MNHLQEQSTPTRETYIMRIPHTFVTIVISLFIFLSCTTDSNQNFTLTTSSEPRESGIITPSDGAFHDGSVVEFSATANENMVFIGWNQASLDSCYWDTEGTNQSNGVGEGGQNGLTGLTTSEMTDSAAESNMSGFDRVQIWKTVPNDYSILQ